ncbi:MAG: HAD family hydrolase [Clostridia bacterium]|nr:HAD family hydrolase [Clostridia bacterium]
MIKLCIFDLDGTVLDTVHSIAYFCNFVLEKRGIEPFADEEYNYLAGGGAPNLIHQALSRRGLDTPELFEEVFAEFAPMYRDNVTYKTTIFDGLKEQLDILKANGYHLAIVSNKLDAQAQAVINATYGKGYFDYVTGQKPGGPVKPDITEVKGAFDYFGVTPDECLYFGDTSIDMITGKRAGIFTVGVLWGFRGEEELRANGADHLLRTPGDLADFVLNYKA